MMKRTPFRTLLLAAIFAHCSTCLGATTYGGFLTPDFVADQQPPYSPVSASANLAFGGAVSGHLLLRDRGKFRVHGMLENSAIRITLERVDGKNTGRGHGRYETDLLEMDLEIFDERSNLLYKGPLILEANIHWRASPVLKTTKPLRDASGRAWSETDFNDEGWTVLELPDDNSYGEKTKHARYYRRKFQVSDPDEELKIVFSSDDGIWIYVNGRYIGQWGSRDGGGCVNDPLKRCGIDGTVAPVTIPGSLLTAGENVIAVKVNNGQCCSTYFNLQTARVRARITTSQ